MMSPLPEQLRVKGILCDFTADERGLGFVDVFVSDTTPPQKLLLEWIVRGALDLETAINLADRIIELRLDGYIVFHDVEGRIKYLKNPLLEGDEWKDGTSE
jgi:hypothetical protein